MTATWLYQRISAIFHKRRAAAAAVSKRAFSRWIYLLVLCVITGSVGVISGSTMAWGQETDVMDRILALKKGYNPPAITTVYADDGTLIGEFYNEYRIVVSLESIPDHVRKAFIAAEDAHFYLHPGTDITSILRAVIKNSQAGKIVQGGSTITQQVVKSLFLSNERTYERKFQELLYAQKLEENFSKDEILQIYLNQIYLGRGAYGVEGAAQTYFDKHVSELSLAEGAFLAGLVRAPARYGDDIEAARERQKYVLGRMAEVGFITGEQSQTAGAEVLDFRKKKDPNRIVPQFTEQIRRIIEERHGADILYNAGLKIYTTVNLGLQAAAYRAVLNGLSRLDQRHEGYSGPVDHLEETEWPRWMENADDPGEGIFRSGGLFDGLITEQDEKTGELTVMVGRTRAVISSGALKTFLKGKRTGSVFRLGDVISVHIEPSAGNPGEWSAEPVDASEFQAALVCLDNATGEVKAMVGGRDFRESQFNRAVQSLRQPGSAFKPIIYAEAISQGFTPADIIWDEPVEYDDGGKIWSPQNYDRQYQGPITLYSALAQSRNVAAVRLLEKTGTYPVIELARRMGITSELQPYLSLALGASEVSLIDLTNAFSVFPNLGKRVPPHFITRIENRYGKIIEEQTAEPVQALDAVNAYVVLEMMKGVVSRGTGSRVAALKRPVAGKTGTSNDLADAWFVGFSPELTCGVWVGKDKREKIGTGETGGRTAAPIFLSFMEKALADREIKEFTVPPGIEFAGIDLDTGEFSDESTLNRVVMCFDQNNVGKSSYSEFGRGMAEWEENPYGVPVFRDDGYVVFGSPGHEPFHAPAPLPDPGMPAAEPDTIP